VSPYLRALRLERWPRSLSIFLGSAAFFFFNRDRLAEFPIPALLWRSGAAFLLTWGISTANYVLNEIVDKPFDAHHPTKKLRPLVLGEIQTLPFAVLGVTLTGVCLVLAQTLFDTAFLLSLVALLGAGIIYNVPPLRAKDIPFLDAISESVNNPIRLAVGWYAFAPIHVFPPLSLLLSWWAFGNYLMVAKRLSEHRFLKETAGEYRKSHKRYTERLLLFGLAVGAAVCLASFLYLAITRKLETFLAIAPFLAVLLGLILRKTLRESEVMEETEKILASAKFGLYTIFLLLLFVLSYFVDTIGA
jgi:decaprenyl-phosphate phosphoribosyltransferase